jgi:hypothetical protein
VLPACFDQAGRPLFLETPEKHFFAVLRAILYAWLGQNSNLTYLARAAYDARATADAADAADAAFAARARAVAAARAAAAAEMVDDIKIDFLAIEAGEDIRFSVLPLFNDNKNIDSSIERDISKKIQSIYGYNIAHIYSCIIQGDDTAKIIFKHANEVCGYCESIWEQLEAGSFKLDDHEVALPFLNSEEFREAKKQSQKTHNNEKETQNNETTEEESDQKIESIKQYIAGTTFSAEAIATEDYLNRQPLADAVMKWLTEKENTSNINLALFGEWGVGKSTFLNMLIKSDAENKANSSSENNKATKDTNEVHLIWGEFNAWRYEHSDNIQAGITQEAVKALKSQLGWLGLTTQYAFKSHPLQLVLLLAATLVTMMATGVASYYGLTDTSGDLTTAAIAVGVTAQLFVFWFLYQKAQGIFSHPLADKLNTYLRLPSFGEHLGSIPVMREQVALLTQLRFKIPSLISTGNKWWGKYRKSSKNQRLIFIVDDLDRCSPDGVVKTLEAVRLVMELDNVVVIVAIDQRVALASLAKHYEQLEKHHLLDAHEIARDYLAKVIHIPIVLEQPSATDIEHYLTNHLWKNDDESEIETNSEKDGTDNLSFDLESELESGSNSVESTDDAKAQVKEKVKAKTDDPVEPSLESLQDEASINAPAPESNHSDTDDKVNQSKAGKPAMDSVEITGLSQEQKTLFLDSVKRLGLTNPRQLKRLDNCYSLLRLRYPDEDVNKNYSRLHMLIWLEYLHEQPSSVRCQFLHDWEQGREFSIKSVDDNGVYLDAKNYWNEIAPALPEDIQQTIYREVRCFILPAVNVLTSAKNNDKITEV